VTHSKTLLVSEKIKFNHLNQNTDVSVTLVEVAMDDRRYQIKNIGIYFRDIVPIKCDKFI
jgi:hypothetical protein